VLSKADAERVRRAGAIFYDWPAPHGVGIEGGETLIRLVTSFATSPAEVDGFLRELGA
jgi:threonine aldolase